jgi:hypothetical protein
MKDKGIEVKVKKDLEDITQPLDKREWKQVGTYTGNGGEQFVHCPGVKGIVIQRLDQDPLEWDITDVNIVNDGTGIDLNQSELERAIKDGTVHYVNGGRGRGKSMLAGLAGLALEELEESAVVFDSMTKIRKGEHIGWTRNLVKRDKKKEKAKKQSRKRNRK